MDKVVLDTNIYISGLLFPGNARKILKLAIENRVHAFISDPMLRELSDVLRREKFKLLEEQILEFIREVKNITALVVPEQQIVGICRDSKDHILLECAVKAKADYIISGDKDLLVLKEFLGTKIIFPEEYLALIRLT